MIFIVSVCKLNNLRYMYAGIKYRMTVTKLIKTIFDITSFSTRRFLNFLKSSLINLVNKLIT